MATVNCFEDLDIWKSAREICKYVNEYTKKTPFCKDFSLTDQIRRSSGSVMDNIAEGFEREGNKEFIQFLYIAKSSAGECRSQIYRAFDHGYISKSEFDKLKGKLTDISCKIRNFIQYLKKSSLNGQKFRKY